jgi:Tfp pilus assembly protein PilF
VALKSLRQLAEKAAADQSLYKYDAYSIRASTRDQRIAAVYLEQALGGLKRGSLDAARESVKKAKDLMPGYSEAYRIAALIETKDGNLYKAAEEIHAAIDHEPKSALGYYQHALFLLYDMGDSPLNRQGPDFGSWGRDS